MSNVVLRKNGELSFLLNATGADAYVFKLIGTDGRLLAQTSQRMAATGLHTVRFSQNMAGNELILVQVIGKKTQWARLVSVAE